MKSKKVELDGLPPVRAPASLAKVPEFKTPNRTPIKPIVDTIEKPLILSDPVTPEQVTETNENKSTEDQSIANKPFPQNKMSQKLAEIDRTESRTEIQKIPTFPKQDMATELKGFNGAISLLPLNCETHREEYIKYF